MKKNNYNENSAQKYIEGFKSKISFDSSLLENVNKKFEATKRHAQMNGLSEDGHTINLNRDAVRKIMKDHDKAIYDTFVKDSNNVQSLNSSGYKISKQKGMGTSVKVTHDSEELMPFIGCDE